MTWLHDNILTIFGYLITGFSSYFLGRKKNNAEVASIEVSTLRATITSLKEVNETLRQNINELQEDIKRIKSDFDQKCNVMQTEIDELRQRLK